MENVPGKCLCTPKMFWFGVASLPRGQVCTQALIRLRFLHHARGARSYFEAICPKSEAEMEDDVSTGSRS